jgi:cell division protein FtsZ
VSIGGASGVLVNITGGADLTLGEVHQINEIIHEAVGDEAEIIFGAVHEPAMQGEIRVTVIATGFDRAAQAPAHHEPHGVSLPTRGSPVIPFPGNRTPRVGTGQTRSTESPRPKPLPEKGATGQDLTDMEIPTFIRRQMD